MDKEVIEKFPVLPAKKYCLNGLKNFHQKNLCIR